MSVSTAPSSTFQSLTESDKVFLLPFLKIYILPLIGLSRNCWKKACSHLVLDDMTVADLKLVDNWLLDHNGADT